MARRNRNKTVNEEEIELDEVDSFNANREKILLDEAGEYGRMINRRKMILKRKSCR